jgi:hypothetical protein
MTEKESDADAEIDALIAELSGTSNTDAAYPLPEKKPVKYTNVDVVVMPAGYKGEYPKPQDAEYPLPAYPLPERKPVKYTNVDVVVMPAGYKGEYPKPQDSIGRPRVLDSLATKLDVDSAQEADGILSVPAVLAKQMVYNYDGFKVLKPADELKAASLFANGIPVTREHPDSGIVTDRSEVLGFLRNPVVENNMLKGILDITDRDLIADVKERKLTEVSTGFFTDLDRSDSGEFEGEHYDATQKNIFLNHVAVVESGRCGIEEGCGIGLDAKKVPLPQELVDLIKAAIERAKAMKDKSLLNMLKDLLKGVTVKVDSAEMNADALNLVKLKDAFGKLKLERDSFKDELEKVVQAEKDSLIQELEMMQDTRTKDDLEKLALGDLQKELDMVKKLKADRLSTPDFSRSSGRKSIDEAYGKIGGK